MRSERKMLPIGVENFEKLRRNNMYYVDKTEIIADLLRNHGDAIVSSVIGSRGMIGSSN